MISEFTSVPGLLCPPRDRRLADRFRLEYWELRFRELEQAKAPKQLLEAIERVLRRLKRAG